MANDLTGNPLQIDTASATPIIAEDVYVSRIRWVGATNAGHELIVKDNKGTPDVIHRALANDSNFIDEADFNGERAGPRRCVGGIAVTTLGSGICYIHLA